MPININSTHELERLLELTEKINQGITLDEVLNDTYDSFKDIIPYDRLSLALLERNGEVVKSHWVRSEYADLKIQKGYTAELSGSTLEKIIDSNQPRIINDLERYAKERPRSESTNEILKEGVRSSLTCPLIAKGKPIGFLFFSSRQPNTYREVHVDLFAKLAGQLSLIAEKSRLYEDLANLNQLKNKVIGIVAHDLRSPISVIQSHLELIDDGFLGPVTEKQKDSLGLMRDWCRRMLALIRDLLSVSAIESGNLQLTKKKTDLTAFIQKLFEFNQLLAKAKSIELVLQADDGLPAIDMDPNRISQVLSNLIANAIKFSLSGTTIHFRVKREGDKVVFEVEDQGQGIPSHEIPKLFDFFSRTSVRPTGGETTTGLGLAIVKQIVETHGGRLSVNSKVGKGSTFSFTLSCLS